MAEVAKNSPPPGGEPEPDKSLAGVPDGAPESGVSVSTVDAEPAESGSIVNDETSANDEPVSHPAVTAIINDRYVVDGGQPVPDMDLPTAKAFRVTDRQSQADELVGLICSPGMPLRTDMLKYLKNQSIRGLLQVVEWESVHWPPVGGTTTCIIYERPLGGRVVDAIAKGKARISEYDIVNKMIEPLVSAISTLETVAQPHRGIRPSNLYFLDHARTTVVLGDCCSGPPGYAQPAIFEAIERCTASPSGRGIGGSSSDVYSLGVTTIIMLLGYNPARDLSLGDILALKLDRGSYAAICGNSRIPIALVEPLRGMLNDDDAGRWTTEDIRSWIDGRKRTPQQRKGHRKAETPYIFASRPHTSPRALAYAFSRDPDEMVRTLKSDENFDAWIRRSLGEDELADRIRSVMEQARLSSGSPNAEPAVVAARICSMLDPKGPIRYRRYAMMPDALTYALPAEVVVNNNKQLMGELLAREVYESWFKVQEKNPPDHLIWQRNFVQCRRYLTIGEPGYGIERCLYEMNGYLPCLSPVLKNQYVTTIRELLPALDATATQVEADVRPLDRHVMAFIAARFDEDIQPHLHLLAAPDEQRRTIGMLSLLAFIQWKTNVTVLHGLTSWVGGLLQPAINSYHSRTTRKEIEKAIPQLVRQGSLPELFNLIDNAEKRRVDDDGFTAAQSMFAEAEDEIQEIESDDGVLQTKLMTQSQKITATCLMLVSIAFIAVILISGMF